VGGVDGQLLRVGEFLRRTRLSPKALRLYGDRGLLVPSRVDRHTGYRWCTPAQVTRPRLVGLLHQAGMPLARVREVVDLEPADRLAAVDRWWRDVEDDVVRRRALVRSPHGRLAGDDPRETLVHDFALRTTDELPLLTTQRRADRRGAGSFITDAVRTLEEHLADSGATRAGA
jgi:DNA-binding transcriptional MerR regulator